MKATPLRHVRAETRPTPPSDTGSLPVPELEPRGPTTSDLTELPPLEEPVTSPPATGPVDDLDQTARVVVGGWPDRLLERFLPSALRANSTEVHLQSGSRPFARTAGRIVRPEGDRCKPAETTRLMDKLLNSEEIRRLRERGSITVNRTLNGTIPTRLSWFESQRGLGVVIRFLPRTIPTTRELTLPQSIATLADHADGLVVVSGPAGSGKSSTLAALIDRINRNHRRQIVIIEQQAEYRHESRRSSVLHRYVPRHAPTVGDALRDSFKEDPDVIMLEDLHDRDAIGEALSAAAAGHLVLASVASSSPMATLRHLGAVFPTEEQAEVRTSLSNCLRAIVSQKLLRKANGIGRALATQILINTQAVAPHIRSGKYTQIENAIRMGKAAGMCSMNESVERLFRLGVITQREFEHATD